MGSPSSPTPGGARNWLKDVLPLDTPYMVQIFPCYACNFLCKFCIFALEREQRGDLSECTFMDLSLFRKCIDEIKCFPQKLKMLRFAAIGEPLLHRDIAKMVAYAKQAEIAQSVDIVTNGSLLTQELSDALIDAGLDRLRISVEGLSAADYIANANAQIDFEQFVAQIRYFYEHKRHTHIYIKIIDYMVQEERQRKRFFELFEPISDSIAIEHLTPTIQEIDYDTLSHGMTADKPQNGETLLRAEVCPQGFYMMQINPDGMVVPCCSMKYPAVLGDVRQDSVPGIWNGEAFQRFRRAMLEARSSAGAVCRECSLYRYDLHPEDVLDDARERLKSLYREPNGENIYAEKSN